MPSESLTVLTYNLYNHHDGESAFANRIEALAATIADTTPDVVCLQEAPSTDFLRALAAFLSHRQKRALRLACTEMRRPDGWSEFLAIIHPGTTRAARVHAAPTGEHVGISVATAALGITVINAHLDPHSPGARHAQAGVLLRALPQSGPVLLCGDLNGTPGGETLSLLQTRLSALAPPPGVERTYPTGLRTDMAGTAGLVLDHILGRDMRVEACGLAGDEPVGGAWPSDHVAVWAKVSLAVL